MDEIPVDSAVPVGERVDVDKSKCQDGSRDDRIERLRRAVVEFEKS